MKLLKTKLMTMLKKFFVTGRISYIEMFLTYIFNFLTIILCTWIPLFYIYNFIFLGYAAYDMIPLSMYDSSYYHTILWNTIIIGASIIVALFVFFGILQGLILAIVDYKKIGAKNRRQLLSAVFLFPVFLILYATTLCIGSLSKPSWGKVKRNTN